jgi:hypothetical protein
MKKFILILSMITFGLGSFAQAPTYVYVETAVEGNETVRTFHVEDNYCQALIDQFTADYGMPEGTGTGNLKWKNVDITGIGTNLTIQANDGARIFDGTNWSHSTFLNGPDMMAKLSADPARARRMYITIKKGGKNKVNSTEKETTFVSMAEAIMLAE